MPYQQANFTLKNKRETVDLLVNAKYALRFQYLTTQKFNIFKFQISVLLNAISLS